MFIDGCLKRPAKRSSDNIVKICGEIAFTKYTYFYIKNYIVMVGDYVEISNHQIIKHKTKKQLIEDELKYTQSNLQRLLNQVEESKSKIASLEAKLKE